MRIMGLSLFNPEFPSPAGRCLLFTTKVMNRTFPSKIYLIFFLDTANLEFNQLNLWLEEDILPFMVISVKSVKSVSSVVQKNISGDQTSQC